LSLKTKSIRGTRDITPAESPKWRHVEGICAETAATYGFRELRIPTIEKTELFIKSVGDSTDVVQKEMYTFEKGRESITLRPEGTAGIVRAALENGLLNDALPLKVMTGLSCFRHENPQAGRLREFHQFDIEAFGAASPAVDAEVILVAADIFARLGIENVSLEINSIGCPKCRPQYNESLVRYYRSHESELCETCKQRLERNPLRLLDCKEERCAAIAEDAPKITERLCEECAGHFEGLKQRLDAVGLAFAVNPKIVRGLDYYTRTVFEFVSGDIGAQATICGGGRYDGLFEQMGGPATPALGFAIGIERLIMVMEAQGCAFPGEENCDVYIGSMGAEANVAALKLATQLRREGIKALCDTMDRSVKAQMKYADKLGARFSCILGENELKDGTVRIKNMQTGENKEAALTAAGVLGIIQS
jgi:histidyl-tRNA synthetase